MSNLVKYAENELAIINVSGEDEQNEITRAIMDVVKVFANEGHSGTSAEYALNILERVLRFKPITPLKGTDNEWNEVSNGTYQNKRCSSVFKDENGFCYDIDAVTFYHVGDNFSFTNGERVREYFREQGPIEFPYAPPIQPVWVEVPREEENEE